MADKSKVGTQYPPIVWEVERGKIKEMVRAIGDDNPIFQDKQAAIAEGYQDSPASPTFLTVPAMWSAGLASIVMDLNINVAMVLHGEEEYEYYQEIYPGDIITGSTKVLDIEEKTTRSGSKMDLVTTEIIYQNQRGEKVARAKTVIVERK